MPRENRGIALLFTLGAGRFGWSRHAVAALPSGKRLGTHCTGRWLGPRAGLDGCEKSRLPPEFDPRAVQPVARRYTDHAIRPTERYSA
jgi:hypothetical protein